MNAPDKAQEIKGVITGVFVMLTAFWGWLGWSILLMLVCMFTDYLTGSLAARRSGTWSSAVARDGLWHKLGEIFALLVALMCDLLIVLILHTDAAEILHFSWSWRWYFSLMVSIWYIITELGSIIENAAAMGANVPKWLTKGLAKLHDQADNLDPFTSDKDKPEGSASDDYTPQHVKKD